MPKFYKKNKKKNNPRYFLNETVDNNQKTLSEEQDESPNGWCFSPDGSVTPSTGTRDGKPACRGIDDKHRPETDIVLARAAFKKMQVAEQKKAMSSIMGNFRNFLNEGFDLDANDDGQLSPDALRRAADELEAGVRSRASDRVGDFKLAPGAMKSDIMLSHILSKYTKLIQKSGSLRFDFYGSFAGSVMYRILRSGNTGGMPGNEEQGVEKALDYFYGFVSPEGGGDPQAVMNDMFPQFEKDIQLVKEMIDLELVQGGAGLGPNYEPTPSTYDNVTSPDGKTFQRVPRPRAFMKESVNEVGLAGTPPKPRPKAPARGNKPATSRRQANVPRSNTSAGDMSAVNDALPKILRGLLTLEDSEFMNVLSFDQREEIMGMITKIKNLAKIASKTSSM